MTLVGGDGFDMYNGVSDTQIGFLSRWSTSGGGSITLRPGRFGGQCVRITDGAGSYRNIYLDFPTNYLSLSIGCAVRTHVASLGTSWFMRLGYSANITFSIKVDASNQRLLIYSGDSTLLGSTPNGSYQLDTWYYVELEVDINDTTGSYSVYIDDVLQSSASGIDTKGYAGGAGCNQLYFSSYDGSGASSYHELDDFYWADTNTRVGSLRVQTLRANGAGDSSDLVPIGASPGYNCVNETLVDGNLTYVQGDTGGSQDLYTYEPLDSSPTYIYGVQVCSFGKKTGVSVLNVDLSIKSGSTLSQGSDFLLTSAFYPYRRMLAVDPDTTSAWSESAVNSVQSGPYIP